MRIKGIAELLESKVIGDTDFKVNRIAEIKDARKGDLVFFFKEKKISELAGLENLAAIVPEIVRECFTRSWIKVKGVKRSMVKILKSFFSSSVQIPDKYLTESENLSHVVVAGQVRISDHIKVGKKAKIAVKSGVIRNIEENESVLGYPADKKISVMKNEVYLRRLPEIFKRFKDFERSKCSI